MLPRGGSAWKIVALVLVRLGEKDAPTTPLLGERCWGNVFASWVPTGLLRTLKLEPQQHPPVDQWLKADVPSSSLTMPPCPRKWEQHMQGLEVRGALCIFRTVSHSTDLQQGRQEWESEKRRGEREQAGEVTRGQALHCGHRVCALSCRPRIVPEGF